MLKKGLSFIIFTKKLRNSSYEIQKKMWWENILEHISFTISVIFLKIGRHIAVRITSMQVVYA